LFKECGYCRIPVSFWEYRNNSVHAADTCLLDQPNRNTGLLGSGRLYMYSHDLLMEELGTSCGIPLEGTIGSFCLVSSRLFPCTFSFSWFYSESFCLNKAQPWVQPYAMSCEFLSITEPEGGPQYLITYILLQKVELNHPSHPSTPNLSVR
jgi:hypothetical protein